MLFGTTLVNRGQAKLKPGVWCLFLPLLWYLTPLAHCHISLCDMIASDGLQALTLNGSTLYLGVENRLYSIPLNESYMDADKHRLALYDRAPESAPGYQEHGHWTEVSWLKSAVPPGNVSSQLTLVEMCIFQKPVPYVHVVYRLGDADEPDHKLINQQTGQVEQPNKPLTGPYGLWANGQSAGYLVQKEQGHIVVKKDPSIHPEDKLPIGKATFYPTQPEPGTIEFEVAPGNNPLPVSLPAFGFIYKEFIHFWDLPHKQVLIFKDPFSSWSQAVQKVTTIPLNQYLVCSNWKPDSSMVIKNVSNDVPVTGNNGTMVPGEEDQGMGTFAIMLIWLIVLGLLGAVGFFGFQYAKKEGLLKKWPKPKSKASFGSRIGSSTKSSKSTAVSVSPTSFKKSTSGIDSSKCGSTNRTKTPSTPMGTHAGRPSLPSQTSAIGDGSSKFTSVECSDTPKPIPQTTSLPRSKISPTPTSSAAAPPKVVGVVLKKDAASQTSGSSISGSTSDVASNKTITIAPGPNSSVTKANPLAGRNLQPSTQVPAARPPRMLYPPASRAPVPSNLNSHTPGSNPSSNVTTTTPSTKSTSPSSSKGGGAPK